MYDGSIYATKTIVLDEDRCATHLIVRSAGDVLVSQHQAYEIAARDEEVAQREEYNRSLRVLESRHVEEERQEYEGAGSGAQRAEDG